MKLKDMKPILLIVYIIFTVLAFCVLLRSIIHPVSINEQMDEFIPVTKSQIMIIPERPFSYQESYKGQIRTISDSITTVEVIPVNELTGRPLYVHYIYDICKNYEYDFVPDLPILIEAMMETESNFQPNVVSSANCVGLMQISVRWQSDRAAKLGVTDLFDPYGNILIGIDLLKDLYFNYAHEDIQLAIMMYNMDFSLARKIRANGELTPYAIKVMHTYDSLGGEPYA